MPTDTPFILASGSASRAMLLSNAGIPFVKIPSTVDEDEIKDICLAKGFTPKAIALKLAEAKAESVSLENRGLVLGADQVLQLDNDLISKSVDMAAARDLLKRMSGKIHYLHAGMALYESGHLIWSHVETAEMSVRSLSDAFIDAYVRDAGDKLLKTVGNYMLEGSGVHLFNSIRGDYFTVLGLPMLPLLGKLRQLEVIPA